MAKIFCSKKGQAVFCMSISTACLTRYGQCNEHLSICTNSTRGWHLISLNWFHFASLKIWPTPLVLMDIMVCRGSFVVLKRKTYFHSPLLYLGPFRRTCEISLGLLRQNEDALMTVLETFLHDPTTDFISKKVRLHNHWNTWRKYSCIKHRTHPSVPKTPAGVLENVRNKLRGLLPGESVPLSVDGHVDELVVQATNHKNLAAMYIGWCPFF